MSDYDASITRSDAQPLNKEKENDSLLGKRRKGSTDLKAEIAQHHANNAMMNDLIRKKSGNG